MGSFGDKLRREREMRGVSLDDIADATKIGTRSLRALEEEHFELLPGGIFNKGFVRAYAKYLGLNEEEAVADYLSAAGESSLDPRLIAEQNAGRIDRTGGESGDHRRPGFPIIPVLILLLVIAAGAGGWQLYQQRVRERQAREDAARAATATPLQPASTMDLNRPTPPAPGSGQATSNPVAAPGATRTTPATTTMETQATLPAKSPDDLNSAAKTKEGAANPAPTTTADNSKPKSPSLGALTLPASTPGASNAAQFEVTVRAKDRAWVSIKSDGKYLVRGIIAPNDVKTVRATDQIVFWTGNAGAVDISFNGQKVPLEGGPNTEGVLVFNSHGVVIPKPAVATQP